MKPTQQPEFMGVRAAAAYLGYNPKHFSRVASWFDIPRHGPKRNRFKRSDLDAWMKTPSIFSSSGPPEAPRSGYSKVKL